MRALPDVILLREVSKRFGAVTVLGPLSLTVGAGTRLALVGPSGAGKSTVLRLIVGLDRPDGGEVRILGEPMGDDTAARLRLRIGYVLQDGALFPHLTAAQNASLVAEQLGWQRPRILQRLEALQELVRLPSTLLARYPAEMSGGERQRAALMRALFLDPELIVLDEPLGAVDPWNRAGLETELLRVLSEVNKAVVLVTHDLAQAAFLTEEIAVLRDGRVEARGALPDLERQTTSSFVTEFIGAQRRLLEALR